jgi:hypothetical protein
MVDEEAMKQIILKASFGNDEVNTPLQQYRLFSVGSVPRSYLVDN